MKQSTLLSITLFFTFCFFGFCIINPYFCSQSITQTLKVCAFSLIPSLFPFVVLSTFFGKLQCSKKTPLDFVLSKIYGLDPFLNFVCFLGLFFGFPSGACAITQSYKQNKCTKSDAEFAIAISNNCSFAFLINVVGVSVFASLKTGYMLFVSQTLSIITVCFILRNLRRKTSCQTTQNNISKKILSTPSTIIQSLIYSIKESVFSMLYICAFTIFFGLVCKTVTTYFPWFSKGLTKSFICGALEITNGVLSCFDLSFPLDVVMTSCVCSLAGLSVYFQIESICQESGLSTRLFLVSRLICAPLSAFYTLVLLLIC